MKQCVTTIFLKIVIILIGITSLVFGVFPPSKFADAMSVLMPTAIFFKLPLLTRMYAAIIILFFALYQAIKLLHYIDNGKVFSGVSIKTLKNMKIAGTLMTTLLYLTGMPAVYLVTQVKDASGLVIIGFGMASMPLIVATFMAILQRSLQETVIIKPESDSTIRGEHMTTIISIDTILAKRKMSVTELAERVGITLADLSILKNGKAKAARFSTLEGICKALDCQPGDILGYQNSEASQTEAK